MSISDEKALLNNYREFVEQSKAKGPRWAFGNEVLYRMCRENPLHEDSDVVVGKVWLIGRSYAAAIERRSGGATKGDDFYFDVVAPKMIQIGPDLDDKLNLLRSVEGTIPDEIQKQALATHEYLTSAFRDITRQGKRSLASKYLHFHCPNVFFIYDSRADKAIKAWVKRPVKPLLENVSCDVTYGDFICRAIELRRFIGAHTDNLLSPREIDDFLLWLNVAREKQERAD